MGLWKYCGGVETIVEESDDDDDDDAQLAV